MRVGGQAGNPSRDVKGLGRHLILELTGCDRLLLSDVDFLEDLLTKAAVASGATIVGTYSERFDDGQGVSAIIVLKESHISIHTWPELGYAALDIYTCGENIDPWKAYDLIISRLEPENVGAFEVIRGLNVSRKNFQLQKASIRDG